MNRIRAIITSTLVLICVARESFGQQALVSDAKKKQLADLSIQLNKQYLAAQKRAVALAKIHGWPVIRKTKNGGVVLLQGVNSLGFPIYTTTYDNLIAAATTGTNTVQPGGSLGLNLSGSSPGLVNKLAEWDGGAVYSQHVEFAGKAITINDAVPVADHATHVAGTMVAKGVNPLVKGMAFNAATLQTYYFDNDVTKMTTAAPGLLLSNHSYGDGAGWNYDESQSRWIWYGLPGDIVDYTFGFYGQKTQEYDNIAYNAPYYLIVEAAGNYRSSNGPPVGGDYWGYKSKSDQTLVDKGPRPGNISNNDGYEIISSTGNAKNILTVGAINPLPNGPSGGQAISIAPFSSIGPTNDGRIKPDIVGDGVDVLSTGSENPNAYIALSGTSMAAPNVTGSLYLLQEYYAQKNGGSFMRAATLKALACHTAHDAGNTGPDYIYGWGLLDMKTAAQTITDNGGQSLIKEKTLSQGQPQTITVVASGSAPLIATISWTDPPGTPTADGIINSPTPKLINDLDIRVSDGTTTFYAWVLDPLNPSAAATKGDNVLDNVEQVFIPGAVYGKTYTITVSHKGTLQSGTQDYSLIVTGIGAPTYCTSGPLSNADSRINNVTLSNLNSTPPAGCTTYSDYTNLTALLVQGKTYPLSLTLGTCGANFDKAAKVYIDWNGGGTFQGNELVATTNIINGTGTYSTSITVPPSVVAGNFSVMRVVLTETADTSTIKPCGSYAKGETQDYRVQFVSPGIIAGAVSGSISACAGTASVDPGIQQFTVSGNYLSSNITATAPAGFELSLNASSGYGGTVQLPQTGGTVNNTVVYVRSAATAPGGNISGDVVLSSQGISVNVAVAGKINALPAINQVPNQGPYLNGSTTQAINFTGTPGAYKWVNDTPGIGLPANGSGDIQPFTAVNTGSTPIVATIAATPFSPQDAYVSNFGNGTVSVINTKNNTVIATIAVGNNPCGVTVSPDGSRAYIANAYSDNVSVINTATNKVIATIPTGAFPLGMSVSPDGSRLYVANSIANNISVINTTTNQVTATIPGITSSDGLIFSPDGSKVYVAEPAGIVVISAATNAIVSNIQFDIMGVVPEGLAISPDGGHLYVANTGPGNVCVINTATNAVEQTIGVGKYPWGITISADGTKVYVANNLSSSVSVINTVTNSVAATIPVGSTPLGVSVSVAGDVYVALNGSGDVAVIDGATNTVSTTVQAGSQPYAFGNFITQGTGCTGAPIKFTITVNPASKITAGKATGTIFACLGTPSASPDLQQIIVSGGSSTGDITVTSPAGFQVSLTPGSGFGNSLTIKQQAGSAGNTTIYVRTSASAPLGSISGDVVFTSSGISQNVTVTAKISALPVINAVPNQGPFLSGSITTAINFTGTGDSYSWTNDNPGIGLPANGTGDIAPFTTINSSGKTIVATVTARAVNIGYAYIANLGSNDVSVINTATNAVVATIPVGGYPNAVAISPDNSLVYVADNASNDVSVISASTNKVIATIPVAKNPIDLTISADGTRVYVTCGTSQTLCVINTSTKAVIGTVGLGDTSEGIAVSPDGSKAYVTNASTNALQVIDLGAYKIIDNIKVWQSPIDVKLSPDGSIAYVANEESNSVAFVSTATGKMIDSVKVGSIPWNLAVSPDGSLLYVVNRDSNTISVINTATRKVIATFLPGGSLPFGISLSPDGNLVYVVNVGSNDISVIDAHTYAFLYNVIVGTNPYSYGDFITKGAHCTGDPVTFTITVTPSVPNFSVSEVTGIIAACAATPFQSPASQFTVSGTNLTGDIVVTAPAGFEISLTQGSGYGGSIKLSPAGGIVNTVVYVRLAASGPETTVSGNVVLTTAGAASQNVMVSGSVSAPVNISVSIVASGNNICSGTPVTFTASPVNAGSAPNYQWLVNGSKAGTNNAGFTTGALANGDVVSCVLTSTTACAAPAASNNITMAVNTSPTVNAGGNKTVKGGSSVTLNGTATGDITDITWSPATGLSNNKILDPVASPDATTTYSITVQTAEGCTATDNATVTVLRDVTIPNTFTPNGDGVNDTWVIKYLNSYVNCTVQVFNRWGQMVFSSIGYGTPWDGSYKGAPLPDGTYYYIIDLKNNSKILSGYVAILR